MNTRLRRRMLNMFMVFCLALTLVPLAALADSAADEAETSVQALGETAKLEAESVQLMLAGGVDNGGFEQVGNGQPVGWFPLNATSVFESVYEPVVSGNYSVRLIDDSSVRGTGLRSNHVSVEPGHLYQGQVYGYNESGNSQLYLEFWNESHQRIDVKIATVGGQQRWNKAEIIAAAPADASYATLLLYQHVSNVGVAYFDDAAIAELSLEYPYNGDFEEVINNKPAGWKSLGAADLYGSSTAYVYNGNYSVKMEDPTDQTGPGLRSGNIPVTGDQLYEATVHSYNELGVSQLYLEFWNSANVRIDVKIGTNSAIGSWNQIVVQGFAPADAAYVTLLLYQHKGNIGIAYFDQATFKAVPPEPIREFPLLVESHPRLYFTAEQLPELQARANDDVNAPFGTTGKQLWSSVKNAADQYLNESSFSITYYAGKVVTFPLPPVQPDPIPNPPGFTSAYPYWTMMSRQIQERLEILSLAYAVTGDQAYADKAKQYMLSVSGWSTWTDPTYPCGGETCLDTSHFTFGVSMAFDILYDQLTEAERTLVIYALEHKGLIPLYKDVMNKIDHNIQSLRAAALGSGAAVLLGHVPDAHAYLTRAMNYYSWYLDERMTSGKQEGMLYTSYAMDNMIKAFDHINRVTGVRELADHAFLNDFLVRWVVYSLAPGGGGLANFSDSSIANYFGLTMNVINAWLNNGQAGWYLQETKSAAGGINGFLYFRPDAVITSPDLWPASTVFDEIGWASLRSGWNAEDILFTMVSNQSTLGHNHYDQNSFQIATNRTWIAADPGYQDYVAGPVNELTVRFGHSTVHVDGKGQNALGNGVLTEGMLAPTYDYVKGSAAGAYRNSSLTRFDRHVVYLKPDTFVIMDDLQAQSAHVYDWILYSGGLSEFTIDEQLVPAGETVAGNSLYLRNGTAELAAKFLADSTLPMTVTQYPGAESYGYYTKVGSGDATTDHRFLTVLKAQPYQPAGLYDENNLLPLTDSSGQEVKLVQAQGSTVIFYRGAQAGDYMTVTVDVPEDGVYRLQSHFLQSPLYGMVQTYIDGQPIGGVYDGYAPVVSGPVVFDYGDIPLRAGTHTFRYEVTGKNEQSGNYFIGLDAIHLLPEGTLEPEKLAITAERVNGFNGIGALVERDDNSDIRDLAIFRTEGAIFNVGGAVSDAEQAVVSISGDNEQIVGFKMTRGSSLQYDGNLLLAGDTAFNASFDTNIDTMETSGVIETSVAQSIEVHAPADALVIVNGQLLDREEVLVDEQAGTIGFLLAAGRHDVVIVTLDDRVKHLLVYGDLTGPMAKPLINALSQVQLHWNKGSVDTAIHHMERYIGHLNNLSLDQFIAESLKLELTESAQYIILLMQAHL